MDLPLSRVPEITLHLHSRVRTKLLEVDVETFSRFQRAHEFAQRAYPIFQLGDWKGQKALCCFEDILLDIRFSIPREMFVIVDFHDVSSEPPPPEPPLAPVLTPILIDQILQCAGVDREIASTIFERDSEQWVALDDRRRQQEIGLSLSDLTGSTAETAFRNGTICIDDICTESFDLPFSTACRVKATLLTLSPGRRGKATFTLKEVL